MILGEGTKEQLGTMVEWKAACSLEAKRPEFMLHLIYDFPYMLKKKKDTDLG